MQRQSEETISPPEAFPLSRIFDQQARPLLDAVDKLRSIGAVEEGINLPTIVVVGDQSSGKSSVLESLSGVELPKGQGIVTRVPLILRLQGSPLAKVTISYKPKLAGEQVEREIAEAEIADAIVSATNVLAGPGKGIAESPITLHVSKPGAPDLTLVDLPGITRVPVQGQPSNIYEIIRALIQRYIKPEESIILNVLSAAMDFSVCESIRMSKEVDKVGKRTLAVVTKVDICPDGLVEKITKDVVKIGLGYICIRNRTEKEGSFEEAMEAERLLFSSHSELKWLSKSMVGVEALASRLIQLQAQSVAGVLPRILKQIDDSMAKKLNELKQIGCGGINNAAGASVTFLNVSFSLRKSLEIILSGGETGTGNLKFTETMSKSQPPQHQYLASIHQEFEKLASLLTFKFTTAYQPYYGQSGRQLDWGQMKRIKQLLSEFRSANLPNVVPQFIIGKMISEVIDSIADTCTSELPSFVHEEARKVAVSAVSSHARQFPYLKKLYTAEFQKALNECKSKCSSAIARLLEMEEAMVYTTDSKLYKSLVEKLHGGGGQGRYYGGGLRSVSFDGLLEDLYVQDQMGFDEVEKQVAFSVLAYWIMLSRRLADSIAHELHFSFNEALLSATDEVAGQVIGSGLSVEQVMAEQPEVRNKRERLAASLNVLQQCKDMISQVSDDACYG